MNLETGVEIERAGAKEEVLVVVPIVGMIAIVTEDGVVNEDVGVVAMSIEEEEVEGTRIATGIVAAEEVVLQLLRRRISMLHWMLKNLIVVSGKMQEQQQ